MSQLPPARRELSDTREAPPRRGRRWLIASAVVLIGLPSIWGGYRWMFPTAVDNGPSDVHIVRTGGDDSGGAVVPVVEVAGGHPIDPALEIARKGLVHIQGDVRDYTARLVKRERVNGKLGQEETMHVKIRNRRFEGERRVVPFSVYLRFDKPAAAEGREVIWVEGANDDCLIAHEGSGLVKAYRAYLPPEHKWAMAGNRYPITHIGLENLVEKLIERGTRERQYADCEVRIVDDAELNGRPCRRIELRHPEKNPAYDFCRAEIYIDKEHFLPIRYAAYSWPETEGGDEVLEEEYTYIDLKLNVGLTDADFDWENPEYKFPSFTFP